jgi:hypothetical protein
MAASRKSTISVDCEGEDEDYIETVESIHLSEQNIEKLEFCFCDFDFAVLIADQAGRWLCSAINLLFAPPRRPQASSRMPRSNKQAVHAQRGPAGTFISNQTHPPAQSSSGQMRSAEQQLARAKDNQKGASLVNKCHPWSIVIFSKAKNVAHIVLEACRSAQKREIEVAEAEWKKKVKMGVI